MEHFSQPFLFRSANRRGVVRANREFRDRIGYSIDELQAFCVTHWIHADDRSHMEQLIQRGRGSAWARHRRREGGWVDVRWTVRGFEGQAVCLGTIRGEPEASPRSHRVDTSSLRQTLNGMARIVESKHRGLKCSITLVDHQGQVITISAAPSLPPAYSTKVEGLFIGPFVGSCGTATFWNVPVIVENIHQDPLWRGFGEIVAELPGVSACWSHPIPSGKGQVLGAMAMYCDEPGRPTNFQMEALEIAARMVGLAVDSYRLEQQVRRTEKTEALGLLAGGVVHDFNNLLAAILGNAELALASPELPDSLQELLQNIQTSSIRGAELCAQIHTYTGESTHDVQSVPCHELVSETVELVRNSLPEHISMDLEFAGEECSVAGDFVQLQRVLHNLINNAVEAIGREPGSIAIEVHRSQIAANDEAQDGECLAPGDYARIVVQDSGCGIQQASKQRIFDPFYSTKNTNRGLGLAIVHGIVLSHGGSIAFESQGGLGTRFQVLLPIQHGGSLVTTKPSQGAAERNGIEQRLLIVDDEPLVRSALAKLLESTNFRVVEASGGREAIERCQQDKDFDCVVLDLDMPDTSGEVVLSEIRRLRPHMPIVIYSGLPRQGLQSMMGDERVVVVHKPAKKDVIVQAVARAIRSAK